VTTDDVWIVIPVGKRETYLPGLLESLREFKNRIVFINNYPNYTKYENVHHLEDFEDLNIYRWWNKGINFAEKHGARYVAVLNDDLKFDSSFIPSLFDFLTKNNLAIADTDRSNNNGGAAWMMDLSYSMRLDERFRWWYGDTEIFDRARRINKFNKFVPGNFEHIHANENLVSRPDLQQICSEDAEVYNMVRRKRGY